MQMGFNICRMAKLLIHIPDECLVVANAVSYIRVIEERLDK